MHQPASGDALELEDPPFCSVVLPALNEARHIGACLDALSNQTYPASKLEVIVVDNGSTDDTVEIARSRGAQVHVLRDVNVGAVRNFGAELARGAIVVFLDSDCVVDPDWLRRGVASLLAAGDGTALGGALRSRPEPSWTEKYWLLEGRTVKPQQRDLMGSCIFIRKTQFFAIGGFDQSLSSGEDTDLSIRLRAAGVRVQMTPDLAVIHLGNPSTVAEFLSRQIWHAENYLQQPGALISDRTFMLVLAYLASCIVLLASIAGGTGYVVAAIVTQIPPFAMSAKRVVRAEYRVSGIRAAASILALDNLYLLGRTLGLLRGLGRAAARFSRPAAS